MAGHAGQPVQLRDDRGRDLFCARLAIVDEVPVAVRPAKDFDVQAVLKLRWHHSCPDRHATIGRHESPSNCRCLPYAPRWHMGGRQPSSRTRMVARGTPCSPPVRARWTLAQVACEGFAAGSALPTRLIPSPRDRAAIVGVGADRTRAWTWGARLGSRLGQSLPSLAIGLTGTLRSSGFASPDLLVVDHPLFCNLDHVTRAARFAYRATDLYREMYDRHGVDTMERRLIARADCVMATSHPVCAAAARAGRRTSVPDRERRRSRAFRQGCRPSIRIRTCGPDPHRLCRRDRLSLRWRPGSCASPRADPTSNL